MQWNDRFCISLNEIEAALFDTILAVATFLVKKESSRNQLQRELHKNKMNKLHNEQ